MSRKQNMAEICRICLNDHGCMTDIHDESVESKFKDLIKCTCIDVKYEESLPNIICHVCLYKLDMWSKFKEQFIQSNKILLEQLEISEASDIASPVRDSHKDESCKTENMKRKRLNRSENSNSDNDKKKCKANVSLSELTNVDCDPDQSILDTISVSDDNGKQSLPKDSSRKDEPDNGKEAVENGNGEHAESKVELRARLLPVRRGRNIERRKASTKRWVERKKALLAATGEDVSDTDSIISDDAQLSPVQKARAKNNADKEAERQKRIAKVLKNLEMNLTEKYTKIRDGDTDSDARKTRLSTLQSIKKNALLSSTDKKKSVEKNKSSLESSIERDKSPVSLAENNVTTDVSVNKPESQVEDETFTPYTLKSELVIGDVTYAVTSMLILADKESSNNLSKDYKSSNVDENSREKNTDIIDAVQLRRINNPVTSDSNNKPVNTDKSVERCLNIEVEGNELDILRRVQVELADFVQKEMKHRIFGTDDSVAKTLFPDKLDEVSAVSRQKLDHKLKGIIERAIKKNIESSIRHADDTCTFTRVSPALTKAAMNLPECQPKVVLKRLDISKESNLYKINNLHVLKQAAPRGSRHGGPIRLTSRKRQIVPPIRYNDYNTSALESDSDKSTDMISPKAASKTSPEHARKHGNLATKKSPRTNSRIFTPVKQVENSSIVKVMDNGAKWTPLFVPQNSTNKQKSDYEETVRVEGDAITENHTCGVCALTFSSRKAVEAHVRTHKVVNVNVPVKMLQNENAAATPPRQKQKMMRCKRCHEIVEARLVKSHVCKTATEAHKCYVCNFMFRTEKLLVRHLESHDQSEFNIVNAIENKKSTTDVSQKTQSTTQPEENQRTETKVQNLSTEKTDDQSDIQSDKVTSTGVKLDSGESIGEKSKETYTCFVCDKIFTDEEVLKDHLQKHCDDLSEGEQSNSRDQQYQCAICGSTLESDQALEEHVGKHLFDDEDDNPNLISINYDNKNNNEKKNAESYYCGQCTESFDSEMSLELHMQEHEEEIEIAEWEKEGMRVINQYQCRLCDELFDTEEDLTEHMDIHNANAHICQLCDKPFRTLEDLQEHVETH